MKQRIGFFSSIVSVLAYGLSISVVSLSCFETKVFAAKATTAQTKAKAAATKKAKAEADELNKQFSALNTPAFRTGLKKDPLQIESIIKDSVKVKAMAKLLQWYPDLAADFFAASLKKNPDGQDALRTAFPESWSDIVGTKYPKFHQQVLSALPKNSVLLPALPISEPLAVTNSNTNPTPVANTPTTQVPAVSPTPAATTAATQVAPVNPTPSTSITPTQVAMTQSNPTVAANPISAPVAPTSQAITTEATQLTKSDLEALPKPFNIAATKTTDSAGRAVVKLVAMVPKACGKYLNIEKRERASGGQKIGYLITSTGYKGCLEDLVKSNFKCNSDSSSDSFCLNLKDYAGTTLDLSQAQDGKVGLITEDPNNAREPLKFESLTDYVTGSEIEHISESTLKADEKAKAEKLAKEEAEKKEKVKEDQKKELASCIKRSDLTKAEALYAEIKATLDTKTQDEYERKFALGKLKKLATSGDDADLAELVAYAEDNCDKNEKREEGLTEVERVIRYLGEAAKAKVEKDRSANGIESGIKVLGLAQSISCLADYPSRSNELKRSVYDYKINLAKTFAKDGKNGNQVYEAYMQTLKSEIEKEKETVYSASTGDAVTDAKIRQEFETRKAELGSIEQLAFQADVQKQCQQMNSAGQVCGQQLTNSTGSPQQGMGPVGAPFGQQNFWNYNPTQSPIFGASLNNAQLGIPAWQNVPAFNPMGLNPATSMGQYNWTGSPIVMGPQSAAQMNMGQMGNYSMYPQVYQPMFNGMQNSMNSLIQPNFGMQQIQGPRPLFK